MMLAISVTSAGATAILSLDYFATNLSVIGEICHHDGSVYHTSPQMSKLEIWGRAQHEAARRPKSDWKYNLWG